MDALCQNDKIALYGGFYHAVIQCFLSKLKYCKTTEKHAAIEDEFQAAPSCTVFWTKAKMQQEFTSKKR